MNEHKIKFPSGSIVKVINPGATYDCYRELAEDMGLTKFIAFHLPKKNMRYTVVNWRIDKGIFDPVLYGIRSTDYEHEYVIGENGLVRVDRDIELPDSLFEI